MQSKVKVSYHVFTEYLVPNHSHLSFCWEWERKKGPRVNSFSLFFPCIFQGKENLKGDTHGRRYIVAELAALLDTMSSLKDDA
jgi:hypothetical protein